MRGDTDTASGAMVQILEVADSAIAEAGNKGTDCQKAAANIAFQAVFDAYTGGILGGFLNAIKSAISNILSLGEKGLEEYLGDKLNEAKDAAKDAFKDWLKKKLQGTPPEVFTKEGTKASCDYKIVSTWDIAGGTYEVVITGDCHCNPIATGGLRSVQLKTFKVVVVGKVSIDLDYNEKIPILHVDPAPKVSIEAECESCSQRKTTKQPEKPGTPPPTGTPEGGGGIPTQPPPVPELPKACDVKPPCPECMPIYDQIVAACDRAKELISELRGIAGQWDGLQNRIAYAQRELDQLKAKSAAESQIAAKNAELTALQQEAKNLILTALNDGIELQQLEAKIADLVKQLEECKKPPCGPKKKVEQPPTGTTPPPTPPEKPMKPATPETPPSGGGGVSPPQGPPVPPAPPEPPPPPPLPPRESRPIVPRKPLPTCWPNGTDAKLACKAWLDIAQQNQLAEDLALKALADAQSDLNQADRLDKSAQLWDDHAKKLDSASKEYADLSNSDAAKAAAAPNKESAAQWMQFSQEADAESKLLAQQAADARAMTAKIKAEAKALRDRVAAEKADEAAKKAAAEASWADYNACLKLPTCPQPGQAVTTPPPTETTTPTGGKTTTGTPPTVPPVTTPSGTDYFAATYDFSSGSGQPTISVSERNTAGDAGRDPGTFIVPSKASDTGSRSRQIVILLNQLMASSGPPVTVTVTITPGASGRLESPRQREPASGSAALRRPAPPSWSRGSFQLASFRANSFPSLAPGTLVRPLAVPRARPAAAAEDADDVDYSLVANGNASGEAIELQVFDPSGKTKKVAVPEGLVLEPLKRGSDTPVAARAAGNILRQKLFAYCLESGKLPPEVGQLYRVASQVLQDKFKFVRDVLRAGRELAAEGKLHPDSDPAAYADFIRQYALWSEIEHWDAQKFSQEFLEHTKKNAQVMKVPWTKQIEQQLLGAVPGRWRDISAILERAHALAQNVAAQPRP